MVKCYKCGNEIEYVTKDKGGRYRHTPSGCGKVIKKDWVLNNVPGDSIISSEREKGPVEQYSEQETEEEGGSATATSMVAESSDTGEDVISGTEAESVETKAETEAVETETEAKDREEEKVGIVETSGEIKTEEDRDTGVNYTDSRASSIEDIRNKFYRFLLNYEGVLDVRSGENKLYLVADEKLAKHDAVPGSIEGVDIEFQYLSDSTPESESEASEDYEDYEGEEAEETEEIENRTVIERIADKKWGFFEGPLRKNAKTMLKNITRRWKYGEQK